MRYKLSENILFIKFDDGEDFLKSVCAALEEAGIDVGVILSCVGMFRNTKVAFFKEEYVGRMLPDPMEIVSMEGNIALGEDNKPLPHIHVCLADGSMNVHGGHLIEATVHIRAELIVLILRGLKLLRRKTDLGMELQLG